ncbi:MAG: hypothetical protein OK438_02745 [Thaumarchaeota archaeon]|nr:hypothetical protein [Nitrososphaerota archaeon]
MKSFEITPEGKTEDKFLASVSEVRILTSGEVIEIELIPTEENSTRVWYKIFGST